MPLAEVMNVTRHGEAPDTAELDVNDFAGAKFHCRTGLLFGVDAFIKANRRFQSPLKFDVAVEIIPPERLLQHHQVKTIELLQEREVVERVRGIGIHHQLDSWKFLSQSCDGLQIFSRPDLDLDALVAGREFLLHRSEEHTSELQSPYDL